MTHLSQDYLLALNPPSLNHPEGSRFTTEQAVTDKWRPFSELKLLELWRDTTRLPAKIKNLQIGKSSEKAKNPWSFFGRRPKPIGSRPPNAEWSL